MMKTSVFADLLFFFEISYLSVALKRTGNKVLISVGLNTNVLTPFSTLV